MSNSADNPCIFPFELIIFYIIGFIGTDLFIFRHNWRHIFLSLAKI